MFHREFHVHKAGDSHTHTTVNQLPHDTADAARLYGEMYDKAAKAVKDLVSQKAENGIELVAYRWDHDCAGREDLYFLAFTINGRHHEVKMTIEQYELFKNGDGRWAIEDVFVSFLSKELTHQIIFKNKGKFYLGKV